MRKVFLAGFIAVSLIFVVVGCEPVNKAAERERRTFTVTSTVTEENRSVWTNTSGRHCEEVFKLQHTAYTFVMECSKFFDGSDLHYPKVGDMMRVKFLTPETADDKLEVLEFYNLTQDMERVRSIPPPVAEKPAPQSVSPESPTRSRSRTLPGPRAE